MNKFQERKYNLNKTSIFILPITGKRAQEVSPDYYNTYLNKELHDMYIVIDSIEEPEINMENSYIPIKERAKVGKWTILTIEIPPNRYNDVKLFMEGKYSKMSMEYKHHLIYVYSPWKKSMSNLYTILFPKYEDRKRISDFLDVKLPNDCEIYDKPVEKEEIFDIVNLLEKSYICQVKQSNEINNGHTAAIASDEKA